MFHKISLNEGFRVNKATPEFVKKFSILNDLIINFSVFRKLDERAAGVDHQGRRAEPQDEARLLPAEQEPGEGLDLFIFGPTPGSFS